MARQTIKITKKTQIKFKDKKKPEPCKTCGRFGNGKKPKPKSKKKG